jgi:hypothetical protein
MMDALALHEDAVASFYARQDKLLLETRVSMLYHYTSGSWSFRHIEQLQPTSDKL